MKLRLVALTGVMAASMVTLGAGVAFAGTPTPTPTVTVTPVTPSPCPTIKTFTPTNDGRDHGCPTPNPQPRDCQVRPITFEPTASPSDQVGLTAKITRLGDHPSPSPSVTETTPPPVVNPLRCRPETFVSQLTAIGTTVVQNRVIATGPVFGTGDLDLGVQTNTFDRFRLPGLFRAVNVPHTGLAFPSINLNLCTASVVQVGLWRFAGGPVFSLFRNAVGVGTYQLVGQWVFPRLRNGACSLLFLRGNPLLQNRIQPTYTNIQVWGTGLARR